jgi:hypothetical protein
MLLAGLELRPRELVEASGRAIAITAVPVSVKVLMDLGQLKTHSARPSCRRRSSTTS